MVRAAAGGVIDFSKANPYDSKWYIRRDLLLGAMQDQTERDYLKQRLHKHLALVASPHVADASIAESNLDSANTVLRRLLELAVCQDLKPADRKHDMARSLHTAWEQAFGSVGDSEVQDKIDATAAGLRAQRMDATNAK